MILKYNDYLKMVEQVREVTDFKPLVGVVLGTVEWCLELV